ncbi:MAG: hypothetical protein K8I82_19385, partial [Anaerolineae bacterium]|nr:hypothetical protein [Anaerolineae bacterium]
MTDEIKPPNSSDNPPPVVPPEMPEEDAQVVNSTVQESAEESTNNDDLKPRLERLGGEPAPDITPEEFARLQQSGQIHIDPRGRVRSSSPSSEDA